MKQITLLFDEDSIELNWNGQKGRESYVDIQEKRLSVLQALGLPDQQLSSLFMDFEKAMVILTCKNGEFLSVPVPRMAFKERAVFDILGCNHVDMTNSVRLLNALVNGDLPPELVSTLLQMEAGDNEANPLVTELLDSAQIPK